MSGSSKKHWSDDPNAPKIPSGQYTVEKVYLAGNFIGAIFYGTQTHVSAPPVLTLFVRSTALGIVIILFFQCMGALLNPIDRTRGGIKWGILFHTAAMFSVLTLNAAISLDIYSISYIDNRDFTAANHKFPPGPYGYQWLIYSKAISIIPNVMLFLNTCLADGFLVSCVLD
jgi:hypothetical protein